MSLDPRHSTWETATPSTYRYLGGTVRTETTPKDQGYNRTFSWTLIQKAWLPVAMPRWTKLLTYFNKSSAISSKWRSDSVRLPGEGVGSRAGIQASASHFHRLQSSVCLD